MKAIVISESEWQVMNVVWSSEPVPTSDIVSRLEESRGWHSRTIRTLLDRLVKKGALTQQRDGKRYSAAVSKEDCAQKERRSFVDRVFGGNSSAMILNVVRETELSDEDISELERLLKEKRK
jgi:BlaI family penicillinase repressor